MISCLKFRTFAALAAALFLVGTKAEAQAFGYFGLGVTSSAGSILVSNSLTYTITVTNLLGGPVAGAVVTNTLPSSVEFLNAVPSLGGAFTNYGSVVVFDIGGFDINAIAQMSLTVQPNAVGFVTNLVVVSTVNLTNTAKASVVTDVTNTVPPQADLGVAIAVPAVPVIVNDFTSYRIMATNQGPDDAPGVFLTNVLPAGVILKGISPTNQTYTVAGSNLVFNLGTLTNGGSRSLQFSLQPTNAGVLNLAASVGSAAVTDTNLANNTATNTMTVTNYLPGVLLAVTNSAQIYNSQNGLLEQSITLSNIGTNDVSAVRVIVTGLTNQQLFNAVGTNSGNPFVVYSWTLRTNKSVNLLLQFFATNYFSLANSQLQAFAVPVPDLAPPAVSSASTNLDISRIVPLSNGKMLIEFPAVRGRIYTVVYSSNVLFSNAMIAPPSFVAPVSPMQWVDYGPPTTMSLPAGANARFYRVIQNP